MLSLDIGTIISSKPFTSFGSNAFAPGQGANGRQIAQKEKL
jgi:hypothetical protein